MCARLMGVGAAAFSCCLVYLAQLETLLPNYKSNEGHRGPVSFEVDRHPAAKPVIYIRFYLPVSEKLQQNNNHNNKTNKYEPRRS